MSTLVSRVLGVTVGLLAALVLGASALIGGLEYAWSLGWIGFPLVGGLLLWQRPDNAIGWLMVGAGASFALGQLGTYAIESRPTASPPLLELAVELLSVGWLCMVATVVCFPSGRPRTRWDQWVMRALVLAGIAVLVAYATSSEPMMVSSRANPWAVPFLAGFARFMLGPGFLLVILLLVAALIGLVRRWRVASEVERLQYRWLVFAVAFTAVGLVATNLLSNAGEITVVGLAVVVAVISAIPLAIGFAITRYRLYDIDRIISRTTSYAVVTGVLLATYGLVVTSVTRLLPDSSTVAVAAATLTAAALARPVYRRIQQAIDRRFNRARYDALRTADEFGLRLRHEVDTGMVSQDLLCVVHQTLQPEGVGLWLRDGT